MRRERTFSLGGLFIMTPALPGKGSRRSTVKSRTGCQNCKRRKIKCGEERPSCQNCARREEVCSLSDTSPLLTANRAAPSQAQTPASGEIPLDTPRALSAQDNGFGMASLTMIDLELLHHYCISTSLTLSSDPIMRNYFLEGVPQVGFSHPYVLYSLLALAASHLAHFRPESRRYYYEHARARHTAATSMATPLLSNISTSNAIPMYCFSILTMFISFGSLRDDDDLPFHANSVMPSWLALFRGVRTVLEANNGAIYSSSIAFLFRSTEVKRLWGSKKADLRPLLEFQAYIDTSASEDDSQSRQMLLDAFQDLRRCFYFFYDQDLGNEAEIRSLFTWMYKIPDEFLSLVQQSHSKAICVLAFLCVLLHRLEYNWWFQGWGTHLIERIYTSLDESHRFWIRWPIQEIGWVPKRETSRVPSLTISPIL